jgi:DNA topoisomerase VI subunit B
VTTAALTPIAPGVSPGVARGHGCSNPLREAFRTSRLLDFCTVKELTAQTGHPPRDWPLVVLKETLDNASDACEDATIDPMVSVRVDRQGITVTDNGPGIPPETVRDVLDFNVRVSSREAYVSPTRGAQGNALKTVVMMPYVLDGEEGRVEVLARGVRHTITVRVDQVRQCPDVACESRPDREAKAGTSVRLHWPGSTRSMLDDAKHRLLQLADYYTFLNPHLTLSLDWLGERTRTRACKPGWKKWRPSDPTCPWWYECEHLRRRVAACIAADQHRGADRTVRELVRCFAGLAGTQKQKAVLEATGMARTKLPALARDGRLDTAAVAKLLAALRTESTPAQPKDLGIIGKEVIRARFVGLGCEVDCFRYARVAKFNSERLPFVLEAAFAWHPELRGRRSIIGVNWSPAIVNPFRELGWSGLSLDELLENQRAGPDQPVIFLLHVACPRVAYTDRGKSAVTVPGDGGEE